MRSVDRRAVSAQVAVVTGAGSGIGRAVARALAAEGYAVVLAGRSVAALNETAGDWPDNATQPLVVTTDVASETAVAALFAAARSAFGRIDLLFNNAGVFGIQRPLDEVELNDWSSVMDVNLTGSFLCAREAFRAMKAQSPPGGRIINNGSLSAHVPRPRAVAYTASKHAITGLTKAISLEGRDFGIACGQIDIGNARTQMTSQPHGTDFRSEAMMDVVDVADAVVFMARLPLDANVQFMTVMATTMPFIGRG